jgi:hypothetical protein
VSITAPWPAKMLRPCRRDDRAGDAAGAVDRDREGRGLIAGATSIAALNGELSLETSLVASTASTSTRPSREKPATMPGVTHLPVASTTCAPAGTRRRAGGDDPAVADDDGAALDRLRAVAERDGAAGDGDVWAARARRSASAQRPAKRRGTPDAARITSRLPPRPAGRARSR